MPAGLAYRGHTGIARCHGLTAAGGSVSVERRLQQRWPEHSPATLAARGRMVEQMEHQAGAGWTGPAGEDTARDSESNDGERGPAHAAHDTSSSGADLGTGSPAESRGARPAALEGPTAPELPATGEPRVDAALKLLERLPGLPVSEHPQLFEQVHAQLSEVLGELDSGTGAVGPGAG
jgi:hypothetical protein